jgi:hypothetical protein
MIKLVQIKKNSYGQYNLTQVYVNPSHIIFMTENSELRSLLKEGKIDLKLEKSLSFTKIKINENNSTIEINVVGTPESIEDKMFNNSTKRILRG